MSNPQTPITRRAFLDFSATGLTAAALSCLLNGESRAASGLVAHRPPKAKRAIHIFLVGGLSQVD